MIQPLPQTVEFREVDLNAHSATAIQFMAETYKASFGDDSEFWGADGKGADRYIEWLSKRDRKLGRDFHIWESGEIIGQVSVGRRNAGDDFNYVSMISWRKAGSESYGPAVFSTRALHGKMAALRSAKLRKAKLLSAA